MLLVLIFKDSKAVFKTSPKCFSWDPVTNAKRLFLKPTQMLYKCSFQFPVKCYFVSCSESGVWYPFKLFLLVVIIWFMIIL